MSKISLLLLSVALFACGSESSAPALESLPVNLSEAPATPTPLAEATGSEWAPQALELKPSATAENRESYEALRAKSVIELQQFRNSSSTTIEDESGRQGTATLTDLNPAIREWFLLRLDWRDGRSETFHLQNPEPTRQRLALAPDYLHGVVFETPSGRELCDLWSAGERSPLARPVADTPYNELCGTRLLQRRRTAGRKTTLEWATDFLRDRVVGGEKITVFVRDSFFKDSHASTSEIFDAQRGSAPRPRLPTAPATPALDPAYRERSLAPAGLGLLLDAANPRELQVGRWYPVRGIPGVFLSAIQPRLIDPELVRAPGGRLNPLDDVELSALAYMVAFDLEHFDLGFALGTDHPRVGWSERVPEATRISALPGPDGFDTDAPLVRTGMVNPRLSDRLVATFTGGFKRSHGAFKFSELAVRDQGTHYGFVEHGTVFSRLRTGLATVVVYRGELVQLKTWTADDEADLWRVRHARQNGLPLVESDPVTGAPRPGSMVPNWAHGNWSGSQDKRLRSLRAGLCLQESEAGRFLIYGYFSTATPSAMARVFLAYGCGYALLLDMNALEHTYLALYRVKNGEFLTQHLIEEMKVLDRTEGGQELPRFVGFADNRDFFYLTRRAEP